MALSRLARLARKLAAKHPDAIPGHSGETSGLLLDNLKEEEVNDDDPEETD